MTENKEKITVDDKEYIVEDMTEEHQYMVRQIRDCKNKSSIALMQAEQFDMAAKSYSNALIESLKKEGNE